MHALITRPLEDAKPLADLLAARGVDCVVEPLLEIVPKPDAGIDLDGVQALLFTSANGVRAFAAQSPRRDLRVLTVGEGSAEAARAAGFENVTAAGGDVDALAALAKSRLAPQGGPLFHAAASALAGDLQGKLESAGFTLRRAVLYDARAATAFSSATRMNLTLGGIDMVLLFSPRTARTFAELWRAADAPSLARTTALCLSAAVAKEIAGLGWQRVATAERPDQDAMLALVEREIQARKPTIEVLPPQSAAEAATSAPIKAVHRSASEEESRQKAKAETPPPPPPLRDPAPAAKPAARSGGGLLAGLIAGAVAAILVVLSAPYWQPMIGVLPTGGGDNGAAIATLTTKINALAAANAHAVGPETVNAAVAQAKGDLATQMAQMSDRIGKLEQASAAAAQAPGPDLTTLNMRIAKLEADLTQQAQQADAAAKAPAPPDLSGDVAALKSTNDDLKKQLADAQDQIKALQSQQSSMGGTLQKIASMPAPVTAAEERRTAVVLALGSLRGALAADKPYAANLKAIGDLAGSDADLKARLSPALDPLQSLAAAGAPTLAQLQASLPSRAIAEAANAEAAAQAVGAGQGWMERLINRLSEAVTVRPVGADATGDGPLPRLARGEAKLKAGDLAGAVAELEGLQGRAATAAAGWLAQAKARLAQDQASLALDQISASLMASGATAP